jgi:hypothetical protein
LGKVFVDSFAELMFEDGAAVDLGVGEVLLVIIRQRPLAFPPADSSAFQFT